MEPDFCKYKKMKIIEYGATPKEDFSFRRSFKNLFLFLGGVLHNFFPVYKK